MKNYLEISTHPITLAKIYTRILPQTQWNNAEKKIKETIVVKFVRLI